MPLHRDGGLMAACQGCSDGGTGSKVPRATFPAVLGAAAAEVTPRIHARLRQTRSVSSADATRSIVSGTTVQNEMRLPEPQALWEMVFFLASWERRRHSSFFDATKRRTSRLKISLKPPMGQTFLAPGNCEFIYFTALACPDPRIKPSPASHMPKSAAVQLNPCEFFISFSLAHHGNILTFFSPLSWDARQARPQTCRSPFAIPAHD